MKDFYYLIPLILQKIGRTIFLVLFKIFLRIEIKGDKEFLKSNKPLILAANHTGELDPVIFSLILPFFSKFFPLYFVSNPQERYKSFGWRSVFYGGQFFNMLGAYQIFSGKKNYAYSLQNHIKLLTKKRTVCIFPEGKRTTDGNILPARGGVGYLSWTTKTPVLPVSINTLYGLTLKDFFLRRKKITVFVGKPIMPEEIISNPNPKVKDFQNGAQMVMNIIEENLKRTL